MIDCLLAEWPNVANDNKDLLRRDPFVWMGIRVRLTNPTDDFLKVKETLTRVGIVDPDNPDRLIQQCFILHKRGQYAILHYTELMAIDGELDEDDLVDSNLDMRDRTVALLQEWGMLTPIDQDDLVPQSTMCGLKIVPFKDKGRWTLVCPYNIGQVKRTH